MNKLRIGTVGFARGDRNWSRTMDESQTSAAYVYT
jgi:hypothetical protein